MIVSRRHCRDVVVIIIHRHCRRHHHPSSMLSSSSSIVIVVVIIIHRHCCRHHRPSPLSSLSSIVIFTCNIASTPYQLLRCLGSSGEPADGRSEPDEPKHRGLKTNIHVMMCSCAPSGVNQKPLDSSTRAAVCCYI